MLRHELPLCSEWAITTHPENLSGVLLLSEQKIATVRLIEQVLGEYCSLVGIEFDSRTISRVTPEVLRPGVLPVFCRNSDERSYAWMRQLVEAKWPFVFYIDDDFWSLDKATELGRFYGHPFIRKALAYAIRQSFVTLASTSYLGAKLARFEADVRVMTPHVHPYLLEDQARLGQRGPGRKRGVRLGFASNSSRVDDLSFVLPELEELLRQNPDWEIDFVGVTPDIDRAAGTVNFLPHQDDYYAYVDLIRKRKWDIVLSPLRDTESARSKTNIKYREFAAMGVPGVFSGVGAYNEVVDGELGIVVENTAQAWRAGILRLAGDAALRRSIARHAKADVRTKYALGRVVEEWAGILAEVAPRLPQGARPFVTPRIRHHYWHVMQDLIYETAVITRLSGPMSGAVFLGRQVLRGPDSLLQQTRKQLYSLWIQKISVRVNPDAVTRVWVGDFAKEDLRRLAASRRADRLRRIRSLRKKNLGDQTNGTLVFDVPQSTHGGTAGVFVRLHPRSSSAQVTIAVSAAGKTIASETCTIHPLPTFSFIPLPRYKDRVNVRATLTLNSDDEAAPEDLTFVADLTRGESPIVVLGTDDVKKS